MRLVTCPPLIAALLVVFAQVAIADNDRSAAIPQLGKPGTMAERSSAALDQISTVEAGRSRLDQIDPASAQESAVDDERLDAPHASDAPGLCVLTPEQQTIVTSLEAQGRLPAGDCEMVAWFAAPRDKDEIESRQSLAESVVAGAPELLGRSAEAQRLAALEEARLRAEAVAAAVALSILAPPPPIPPGK